MRRAVPSALAAVMALTAPAGAEAKTATKCHWVKATKKHGRHRVCVVVRRKAVAPAKTTPTAAPAAPPTLGPGVVIAPVLTTAPAVPARPQVTAREFSLTLSRPTVAAGALIAHLVNRGEDPHDLHLRDAGGHDLLAIDQTDAGGIVTVPATSLAPGSYTLYCALPGHETLGMHATLTVS